MKDTKELQDEHKRIRKDIKTKADAIKKKRETKRA